MLKHIFKDMFKFLTPKDADQASLIRFRLSLVYGFLGWNSFIYMAYKLMNYNLPTDPMERKAAIISKMQGDNKVQLVRFDGFTMVENRTIEAPSKESEVSDKDTNKEESLIA